MSNTRTLRAIGAVIIALVLAAVSWWAVKPSTSSPAAKPRAHTPSQRPSANDPHESRGLQRLEKALNSAHPQVRLSVIVPEHRRSLQNRATQPMVRTGTKVAIDATTLRKVNGYTEVIATVGKRQYALRLVLQDQAWYVLDTVER